MKKKFGGAFPDDGERAMWAEQEAKRINERNTAIENAKKKIEATNLSRFKNFVKRNISEQGRENYNKSIEEQVIKTEIEELEKANLNQENLENLKNEAEKKIIDDFFNYWYQDLKNLDEEILNKRIKQYLEQWNYVENIKSVLDPSLTIGFKFRGKFFRDRLEADAERNKANKKLEEEIYDAILKKRETDATWSDTTNAGGSKKKRSKKGKNTIKKVSRNKVTRKRRNKR